MASLVMLPEVKGRTSTWQGAITLSMAKVDTNERLLSTAQVVGVYAFVTGPESRFRPDPDQASFKSS